MKYPVLPLLLLVTQLAAASDASVFDSPTVGFSVTKPAGWQFASAEQNRELLENVRLNDDEFRELMLRHANVPLVVMMKHPEPYDDLNPGLKATIRPFGQRAGRSAHDLLTIMLPQLRSVFSDFRLEQEPVDTALAGLPAV